MNKKFLISWVVVFVVWMVGSFLLHGGWLGETYKALTHLYRSEDDQMALFHYMLIGHILMAGGFVWIYQRGIESKPWIQQGLRFGLAVAIFAPIPTYMIFYVVLQMPASLFYQQVIGDSLLVVLVALVTAFLNRN